MNGKHDGCLGEVCPRSTKWNKRRHSEHVETLQRQVERLSGWVNLTGYSGTFGAAPGGGWR